MSRSAVHVSLARQEGNSPAHPLKSPLRQSGILSRPRTDPLCLGQYTLDILTRAAAYSSPRYVRNNPTSISSL